MKPISPCLAATFLCILTSTAPAIADTLVITYASGKVQTIELDERAKDVQDIQFGESSPSVPEKLKKFLLGKPPQTADPAPKAEQPATKKPGVKYEWSAPTSE